MKQIGSSRNGAGSVARIAPARGRQSDRVEFLPNVDGRTLLARRWQQHATDIISDQGGSDMSTARLFLCKRLAAVIAMAEDMEAAHVRGEPIDINAYLSLVQTSIRLSNTLGLNRRAKNIVPSLDEIENEYGKPRNGRVRLIEHEEDDDE